jgi:nucleotide-binding universal stress UspA family protein
VRSKSLLVPVDGSDCSIHALEYAAEAALKPALAAARRLKLEVTLHTEIGDPAAAIVAFAKKKRCGEIVMGNSGLGALAGLVMGSVARKVVFLAKTPVVLVK